MLWNKTRHTQIVAFLKTKIEEALPEYKVLAFPYYFASPQDFAASFGENSNFDPKTYKVKCAIIYYGNFLNSKTKGCEDDPNLFIALKIQLYRTLQQHTVGDVNSHDLLVDDIIDLRNKLLNNLDIEFNRITIHEIAQMGDMINAQQCQFVVGDLGDWVNLRLTIEVNHE